MAKTIKLRVYEKNTLAGKINVYALDQEFVLFAAL